MHQLIIEDSAGAVIVVPLMHARISVGRGRGNVVRLTDQNVSRRHARLVRQNGRYLVEDLDSLTGTRINGAPLTGPTLLAEGDQVGIGEYRIAVKATRAVPSLTFQPSLLPESHSASRAWVRAARQMVLGLLAASVRALSPEHVAALARSFRGSLARPAGGATLALGLPMLTDDPSPPPPGPRGPDRPSPFLVPSPMFSGTPTPEPPPPPPRDPPPRRARLHGTLLLAGVAVVMATAGALFAPLMREGAPDAAPEVSHPAGPVPSASPALPAPAAPAPLVPAGDPLADAKKAFAQRRWSDALNIVQRDAARMPGSSELQRLRRAIVAEHENESTLQGLKRALDFEDYPSVLRASASIPEGSVYRDRAQALAEAARTHLVVQHVTAGERSRGEGDCRTAEQEARAALVLDPSNPTAASLLAVCAQAPAPRRTRLAAALAPAGEPPRRPAEALLQRASERSGDRAVVRAPFVRPAASMLTQPPPRPPRRPIDPRNPYAADLP